MKFTNPFADPMRRPRWIVWIVVVLIASFAMLAGSQIVTSSPWFCNDVCHNVHQDNASEWKMSTHRKIGCVQCHYPPDMAPLPFLLDRVDKLLDIYPTIVGEYVWPVNLYSHIAAIQHEDQCLQCHSLGKVRTSPGIKIDHEVHAKAGINCTQCHNRVCHPEEEYNLQLPFNKKKQNFITMPGCMRCHTVPGNTKHTQFDAPGTCGTCHTRDFDLTPKSHLAKDWANPKGSSKGHATAAKTALSFAQTQEAIWLSGPEEEFYSKEPRILARLAIGREPVLVKAPPYWTIFDCENCHNKKFCSDCHGVEVPHPADFKTTHSKTYKQSQFAVCAKCHNTTKNPAYAASTCSQCHHPQWKPQKGSWIKLHGPIAKEIDTEKECLTCHEQIFCSSCHVKGKPSQPY